MERSKNESRPTMMAFSRQAVPNLPNSSIENTMKGRTLRVFRCEVLESQSGFESSGSNTHILVQVYMKLYIITYRIINFIIIYCIIQLYTQLFH